MVNHQRQSDKSITCVFKIFSFLIIVFVPWLSLRSISCNAHLIHIDHHEFRASGFPRPHQHPPLTSLDELPQHVSAKELTPSEYMVDLTNDLAYRILHYHSILNRNNFAFSPTALMSVLVAIYEGSSGRSVTELKNVLQFPNNRDVIRVGYRDVHRRLRTYFFGSDNPLKGLSLNKDNVTITRDYETILMFYGYDLGMDMVSSTAVPTTTPAATMAPTTAVQETTIALLETTTETITTKMETTTTTAPTTTFSSTIQTTTTEVIPTSKVPTIISTSTTTSTTIADDITTNAPKETTTTTEIISPTTEETTAETPTETTAETPTETTTVTSKQETEINEAAELISSFVAEENSEPLSRIQKARVTRLPSAKLQAPLTSNTKPQANYLPSHRKSNRLTSRSKRHLFGFKELDSNLFVNLFQTESQLHNPLTALNGVPSYVQVSNEYEVDTDPNFIISSQTSSDLKQNYNTDVISHVFYLNNQQVIYTTFKVYNAVLYYKYFDHLRMSVLELELDTPEYNLMILLPDYNTDLVSAASSLRAGPKLRSMRKQLKPKWVQAIIPDFRLHGTMFLTNDLQNLGICDIFEPNRADFRPMTEEKGTYVKHIEQSINIHIRTNPINQLRRNNAAQVQPIQISVNHPFMFFIIDRDLDVAVMAGRILNPLNVRIQ